MHFFLIEIKVSIFGSTENSLACNGSDMDFSLLFNKYFPDNAFKQQKMPKIKTTHKKPNVEQDSSDSNMAESVEAELEEDVDLEENDEENSQDQTLKESIKKFFVK